MRERSRREGKKRMPARAASRALKVAKPGGDGSGSSGDRLLAVLALFTVERPQWTVEAAANKVGVSVTTTYRYFKRLTNAGLITPMIGSKLLAWSRYRARWIVSSRSCDPMLGAARGVMLDLIQYAAEGSMHPALPPVP